jgi:hypothetical protein
MPGLLIGSTALNIGFGPERSTASLQQSKKYPASSRPVKTQNALDVTPAHYRAR